MAGTWKQFKQLENNLKRRAGKLARASMSSCFKVLTVKVLQIVPDINKEASGPSYSVPALCESLCEVGCEAELHFTGPMPNRVFRCPTFNYPVSRFPHSRLARSPKMLSALKQRCRTADIIHGNSIWMYPNVYPAWAKTGTKCKLVTAPRGTLAKWSLEHHRLRKYLFGVYAQYAALRATDMWHATCRKEYEEIRNAGYGQPVAIVPIGMNLPDICLNMEAQSRENVGRLKRVVFFGRLHQVKAVDNLVLAWGSVAENFRNWELVIAGPDCGIKPTLERIIADQRIPRVRFVGERNGEEKYKFLASADLYVLPSYTENFAITVAEALASGTPVIASQGTPWNGLDNEGAGRWIPIGAEPLAKALTEVMSLSDAELRKMGKRGQAWIERDFSWKGIGAKMKAAYEWLLGRGDKPDWVVVD